MKKISYEKLMKYLESELRNSKKFSDQEWNKEQDSKMFSFYLGNASSLKDIIEFIILNYEEDKD